MESKRLKFSQKKLPVIHLKESGVIEVPAGESHFHITQTGRDLEAIFHLRHPDSRVLITGQVIARLEETPQLSTQVIHHVPNTQAETLIRTLVYDAAQPRYQGLIRIKKEGQNCQSFLNHHSLLLGEKAKSWTLPSLEILADQVKCSHAATIRNLDELDLFYLGSRGISLENAQETLIQAFLADLQF